ncbi:MAG: hypothetical protein PF518_19335, partial [Spirochaetaceae bacterium]|nr:hypothetical protein [Spirochaetaceae bacterium]
GSPGKVAKKYSGERLVIGSGFTDLYFLISKILIFAMTVAFFTIFLISLFTENLTGMEILKSLGEWVLNVYNTSLAGIGMLTIIFIIITRFVKESHVDLEENWTPKELKGIPLGEEVESKFESFFSIFFIMAFIIIINFFPQLINFAENSFERSGILLASKVNLERFTMYAILMTVIWIAELIYHLLILKIAVKTKELKIYNLIMNFCSTVILLLMITDNRLFVRNPESTLSGLLGFRGIFLLILIISTIEVLFEFGKWVYKSLVRKIY